MIELTTQALVLVSLFYGNPAVALADRDVSIATQTPVFQEVIVNDKPITLEAHVREYYKDTPILAEVARCESTFRHILSNGKVVRGEVNPSDVGVMQINEGYHAKHATNLGYNLKTLDGNLAYAKWLYEKQGLRPWASSSKCWKGTEMTLQTLVAKQ